MRRKTSIGRPRILFVTHDVTPYGASRSLQLLLHQLEGFEIDLVVPKYVLSFARMRENRKIFRKQDEVQIRKKFGSHIRFIYQSILDCDWMCYAASSAVKKNNVYAALEFIFGSIDKLYLRYIVWKNRYVVVHLNSTVLHRYASLTHGAKTIIHIREELKRPNQTEFVRDYQRCDGAIFIDRPTFSSLACASSVPNTILMNPFDMTDVYDYGVPDIDVDFRNRIVFGMFGQINDFKGVSFVVEGFVRAQLRNAVLLIVGRGSRQYIDECREKAGTAQNIYFIPEEEQIKKYYAVTDYIIRGDENLGMGRTIYEALYAGCGVVVPGKEDIFEVFFEYERFQDKVFDYSSRDFESFTVALKCANRKKDTEFFPVSNTETHGRSCRDFIMGL